MERIRNGEIYSSDLNGSRIDVGYRTNYYKYNEEKAEIYFDNNDYINTLNIKEGDIVLYIHNEFRCNLICKLVQIISEREVRFQIIKKINTLQQSSKYSIKTFCSVRSPSQP